MDPRGQKTDGTERAGTAAGGPGRVAAYWNTHIHDLEIARHPPGSPGFFRDLEDYRFEKLHYLPRLVDFAGWRDRDVLEIGCGVGTDLARFARGGARVTGLDLAGTAIRLARGNLAAQGVSGRLLVGDGASLPLADASQDLVYAHGVLQYAPDPGAIVGEARRVLRPEGQAIFMVYNRRSWLFALSKLTGTGLEHQDAPFFRTYTAAGFRRLLTPHFRAVRIVPERFPVASRLHRGLKGMIFNGLFVKPFNLLPRALVGRLGWHLMAFCETPGGG